MSLPARNREIHLSKSINFWAESSTTKIVFDATQSIHNALNFQPDGFYVKTLYISGHDAGHFVPVLTCNFTNINNTEEVLGVLSTNGTVSHPNTLFDFAPNVPITQLAFELRELVTQGTTNPTSLNNVSWFCVLEFFQYTQDPEFG